MGNPLHGPDEPAAPVPEVITDRGDQVKVEFHGLTIFQYAAIHIHAALVGAYGFTETADTLVALTMEQTLALMKEIAE